MNGSTLPDLTTAEVTAADMQRSRVTSPETQRAIYALWQGTTGGNAAYVKATRSYLAVGVCAGVALASMFFLTRK